MTRVAVFVDYQNTYMRARASFGDPHLDHFTFGQVDPRRLALLLTDRGRSVDSARILEEVRLYRGEPDAKRHANANAAYHRQLARWQTQPQVSTFTRPLHYRSVAGQAGGSTRWEVQEKGIDVMIAIDMVMGAVNNTFDVAVLVSADTDLVPALEAVLHIGKRVEVASWRPNRRYSRLSLQDRNIWCHWLTHGDFDNVSDRTDYTKPPTARRSRSTESGKLDGDR